VKVLLSIVAWCWLFVFSWPLAVLALVLWPLFWLLSIPFRLVSITLDGMFALAHAVLLLPARLFGFRNPTRRSRRLVT